MATLESVNKATSKEARLLFVDNIRWLMIVLVICHHSAVTYSHVGSWYYMDPAEPSLVTSLLLATFETFNQAYFMGFLFLIAGYFVPRAYDLKRRRSVSGKHSSAWDLLFYSRLMQSPGRFAQRMSRNSFTAYFLDSPLLIAVMFMLKHWPIPFWSSSWSPV